jgi:hypothetical protein
MIRARIATGAMQVARACDTGDNKRRYMPSLGRIVCARSFSARLHAWAKRVIKSPVLGAFTVAFIAPAAVVYAFGMIFIKSIAIIQAAHLYFLIKQPQPPDISILDRPVRVKTGSC